MENANSTTIVGAQWGDEGKGKIVDVLSEYHDLVVRYQGGANAGHTVVVGNTKFKLHLVPSGVIRGKRSLIGAGVVLDVYALSEEIEQLAQAGIKVTPQVLGIDSRATLILPSHKALDGAMESSKGEGAIGTTKKGIGPAYVDLASRTALRFGDVAAPSFDVDFKLVTAAHERILKSLYSTYPFSDDQYSSQVKGYCALAASYKDFIADVSLEADRALKSGRRVLFEGAQGTMLDNSFGTYPFVTSSHPSASGACIGAGVSTKAIQKVEGVAKAYCTRVGSGPFPTEITGTLGDKIRETGGEYGTTTGRPRRVGWFDSVALRFANRLNGFDGLHITKLDVLGGIDELLICTHYDLDGKVTPDYPASTKDLARAKPVFEKFEGFESQTAAQWKLIATEGRSRGISALPSNAQLFIKGIEKSCEVPVASVSVGAERDSIFFLRH